MKRKVSRFLKAVGVLMILAMLVCLLLQTVKGKEILAALLSRSLSRSEQLNVQVGTIRGWVPMAVQLDRVEIGDAQGTWLVLRNIRSRWVLSRLLRGEIRLRQLDAEEIELLRLPAAGSAASAKQPGGGRLERMDIIFDGVSVDRLKLDRRVAGMPMQFAVRSGGIVLSSGKLAGELGIDGDAVGRIGLEAAFGGVHAPRLAMRAELDRLVNPALGMDQVSGCCEMLIDADGIDGRIAVELARESGEEHLSSRIRYASKRLQLEEVVFEGPDVRLQGRGEVDFSGALTQLAIDARLDGGIVKDCALSCRAEIGKNNGILRVVIPSAVLRVWDLAEFWVSGYIDREEVALETRLAPFEIPRLPFAAASRFSGSAAGYLSIEGRSASPRVGLSVDVAGFSSAARALDQLPKMDIHLAGGLTDGAIFIQAGVTNFESGYLIGDATVPCEFSLLPYRLEIRPEGMNGTLDAVLDLDLFNALALFEDQHVAGLLTAELDLLDGRPAGFLQMENASYEHYEWGLLFRDFNARFDASPDGIAIARAAATDGRQGSLRMTGGISRAGYGLSLVLDKAGIVRRPEIETVMSGKVTLEGALDRPKVSGRLVVDRADLLPDNMVSAMPPRLENYDAHAEAGGMNGSDGKTRFPLDLDLWVEMPDQVYVNASLIDSVWGGSLHLRNSDDGFALKGKIQPRRGFVDFIGKKFRLIDGSVEMDSSIHALPVMNNLTAEYSRSDITARLILNGSVDNPQYLLEASPALPEDEILSQILFKRNASTISPYQAVQIATAAQQLSGGLNGPGFMYQFRQAVKVDTLEWREPDSDNGRSSVAAGKYITPEFYVEVSSTVGADAQTDMTAEYEINRHFSVETSAGPKLRPGIGLNWKNDY